MKLVLKFLKNSIYAYLIFLISRLLFLIYNLNQYKYPFVDYFVSSFYGFRLDFSTIGYVLFVLTIFIYFISIFKIKLNKIGLIFLSVILAIFFLIPAIIDWELYSKWGNKFNSQALIYISHPREMALSAGETPWLKFIIFLVIWITICFYFINKILKEIKPIQIENKLTFSITFLVILLLNFIIVRSSFTVASINQSSAYYSSNNAKNALAINSTWNTFYYLIEGKDNFYNNSYFPFSDMETDSILGKKTVNNSKLFNSKNPNIVLIVLESFTAHSSYILTQDNNLTPGLDSLSKQGLLFTKCYASGDRTEKGLVSILSGYPSQPATSIGVFHDKTKSLPGLPKTLKNLNYQNGFVYAGDSEFASMKSYLNQIGFENIFDKSSFKSEYLNSKWGAHDEYLYQTALELLKNKTRFFYTLLTLSSHEPFDVPVKSKCKNNNNFCKFKHSIKYADSCLFNFIEKSKKENWYDNTIFIVVADHGHDIGQIKQFFFGPENYHIPLLIFGKPLKSEFKGKKIENVVSQTIIPSLISHSLDLKNEYSWQNSFLDTVNSTYYFHDNGIGILGNNHQALFDNRTKRCYFYNGISKDSVLIINKARAFQQKLLKDYNKR